MNGFELGHAVNVFVSPDAYCVVLIQKGRVYPLYRGLDLPEGKQLDEALLRAEIYASLDTWKPPSKVFVKLAYTYPEGFKYEVRPSANKAAGKEFQQASAAWSYTQLVAADLRSCINDAWYKQWVFKLKRFLFKRGSLT